MCRGREQSFSRNMGVKDTEGECVDKKLGRMKFKVVLQSGTNLGCC